VATQFHIVFCHLYNTRDSLPVKFLDRFITSYIFKARSWHPKQLFEKSTFVGYTQLTSVSLHRKISSLLSHLKTHNAAVIRHPLDIIKFVLFSTLGEA